MQKCVLCERPLRPATFIETVNRLWFNVIFKVGSELAPLLHDLKPHPLSDLWPRSSTPLCFWESHDKADNYKTSTLESKTTDMMKTTHWQDIIWWLMTAHTCTHQPNIADKVWFYPQWTDRSVFAYINLRWHAQWLYVCSKQTQTKTKKDFLPSSVCVSSS